MAVKGKINFKNREHWILVVADRIPLNVDIPATRYDPDEDDERGVPGVGYYYYVFEVPAGPDAGKRVGIHFEDDNVEFTFTADE